MKITGSPLLAAGLRQWAIGSRPTSSATRLDLLADASPLSRLRPTATACCERSEAGFSSRTANGVKPVYFPLSFGAGKPVSFSDGLSDSPTRPSP